MRKLLVATLGVALSVTVQPVAAEPWNFDPGPSYEAGSSLTYAHIQEAYDVGRASNVGLLIRTSDGNSGRHTCFEFPSEACSESYLTNSYGDIPARATYPYYSLVFDVVMPACSDADSNDFCVEDLRVYGVDADPQSANFLRSVDNTRTPAVPTRGIPAGGHVSLWEAQVGSGFEGLKLAAVVQATFVYYPFSGPNYVINDFSAQVIPYVEETGSQYNSLVSTAIDPSESATKTAGLGTNFGMMAGCVWQVEGSCGKRIDSPDGVRYGLTLRSGTKLASFMNGRLKDPTLDVETVSGVTRMVIDAEPVQVAEFGLIYQPTEELKRRLPFIGDSGLSTKAFFPDAVDMISGLREVAGDKASGENTTWRISTFGTAGLTPCYEDYEVAGLVTTNATAYGGEPPKFESGFLNYTVAGMHYLSNGSDLFVGTYDLVMRSEVARCLYGYSKAPVSATVTVVGNDGAENIATTVVSERDGWLKLAAYGFTFSEKEIKVRITQPQIRTLSLYSGRTTALSNTQKAQIRATLAKGDGNTKFICTGIRYFDQPLSENILVRKRAKLACDYAKSLRPDLSYWFQTKTTQARSYNGRVLVVSK